MQCRYKQDSDYSHEGRAVTDWMGTTGGHLWDWLHGCVQFLKRQQMYTYVRFSVVNFPSVRSFSKSGAASKLTGSN